MAKTINTHEAIFAAGEELEAANPSAVIEPWEVYKSLGGRGKFDRVRDIWEAHQASRSAIPTVETEELPTDVAAALNAALATLEATICKLFVAHSAGLVSDQIRQMQLAHNQHSTEMNNLKSQLEYWRETALEAQEQLEQDAIEPKPRATTKTTRSSNAGARKPAPKKPALANTEEPKAASDADPDQMALKI